MPQLYLQGPCTRKFTVLAIGGWHFNRFMRVGTVAPTTLADAGFTGDAIAHKLDTLYL